MVARAAPRKSRTVALIEEVRLQNITIVKTLAELHDDFGKRFDAVDKRFDGIDQRFDGIDGQLVGINERLGALERRTEQLADAIRTHSKEIKALRDETGAVRRDLERYAADRSADHARIEELEKRVARLEERLGSE